MARNRIIYGSQSVWCNGEILYRVQTLGSTTTFTSEDIFELGHLDIVDVVDDVPAVAVTLNSNDWGDVKTMAILSQVAPAKIDMDASAIDANANLAVVDTAGVETGTYLHGVSLADFAVVCGNLPGVSLWAPVQSECDLGTLANNIDQTLYMDEVYVNSLELGYTTGANATENYGAETDQKMWLLNSGRFVNWEDVSVSGVGAGGTFEIAASGVTLAVFSDNNMGFLRTDEDGARGMTLYYSGEMAVLPVVSGSASAPDQFSITGFNYASPTDGPYTIYVPSTIDGVAYTPGNDDKVFALYSADAYVAAMGNTYFTILDATDRADTIGAIRQGQVEVYLVSDTDPSFANAWRLTGCTITSDLTREALAELGHLGPYDRPLTLPVPITATIDATAGDLEHWSRFADRYSEYAADTMVEIDLADLMASDDLKLVVKVFAQTDEEAGGTGGNRRIAVGSDLLAQDYWNDGAMGTYAAAGEQEYALKTIIVEHIKITDEAYTLDMGTNATQTFGFRSTNDLYAVKGDIGIGNLTSGNKVRRNA
jgi:hypothetical protein